MPDALILGAGQIGVFTAGELAASGFRVQCVDLEPGVGFYRRFGPRSGPEPEACDLSDMSALDGLLDRNDWRIVVCAVGIAAAKCHDDPELAEVVNVKIPAHAARRLADRSEMTFVQISSLSVYGNVDCLRLTEDLPRAPRSAYGRSKARAEEAVLDAASNGVVIVRPCGVYGPLRVGRGSHSARFIDMALTRAKVHGAVDLRGSAGGGDEYIYVRDLAEAIVGLAGRKSEVGGVVVNIGTGRRVTVHELGDTLRAVAPEAVIKVLETKSERPPLPPLSIDRLRDLTGFIPRYSLFDGLSEHYKALGGSA